MYESKSKNLNFWEIEKKNFEFRFLIFLWFLHITIRMKYNQLWTKIFSFHNFTFPCNNFHSKPADQARRPSLFLEFLDNNLFFLLIIYNILTNIYLSFLYLKINLI